MKIEVKDMDIHIGDKVRVIKNKGLAPGNEAIGQVMTVTKIYDYGLHPLATDWRDKNGLTWCWDSDEVEKVFD